MAGTGSEAPDEKEGSKPSGVLVYTIGLLGAVILIPLTELTRSFIGGSGRGVDLIVYGGLIVAISLARPEGLVGLFSPKRKGAAR